jgi:hypothetical protein
MIGRFTALKRYPVKRNATDLTRCSIHVERAYREHLGSSNGRNSEQHTISAWYLKRTGMVMWAMQVANSSSAGTW